MSAVAQFKHQFVTSAPRELKQGVLYVSLEYCTMLHICACGCGRKVVTPLSPNDWSMTFNGKSVSVNPSIGSWSLPCQSHYFIQCGKVLWAGQWSDEQIKKNRQADLIRKRGISVDNTDTLNGWPRETKTKSVGIQPSLIQRIISWIRKEFR